MAKLSQDQRDELQTLIAESVKQTLIQLGISSDDPIEMQRDMQHLREWRKSMESVRSKSFLTLMTILLSGVTAMLWLGFKQIVLK
jgi:hypothetical protein